MSLKNHPRQIAATAALSLVAVSALSVSATTAVAVAHPATVKPGPASAGHISAKTAVAPLPTSKCQAVYGISCYSPLQYRTAYNLNSLYKRGITGKGRTIVIVDSFGSPTIQHDLET